MEDQLREVPEGVQDLATAEPRASRRAGCDVQPAQYVGNIMTFLVFAGHVVDPASHATGQRVALPRQVMECC